jgi:2-polyprenyl-3-methyl-5-hydroxy-6-metoxy-1,4-benzoquinol methylase
MSAGVAGAGITPARPIATVRLDRCRVCDSRHLAPRALRYEYRGASFPLVECRVCGMRFLSVQPAREAFAELYSAEYFVSDYRCGRSDTPYADEAAFRVEDTGLLAEFAKLGPPGALLEIGAAGGWLLRHAAERGWRAQGVEISDAGVEHARSLGLTVFHGDLEGAALPTGAFDLVYMGDVLEHVPDCRATLVEVRRVLRPGGHLYLRGPITTNSLARSVGLTLYEMLGQTIVLREPPYHLWEFRPESLQHLCRRAGMDPISFVQSKIPPGRTHGRKTALETLAMNALDAINVPITKAFNSRGDRAVLIARAGGTPPN